MFGFAGSTCGLCHWRHTGDEMVCRVSAVIHIAATYVPSCNAFVVVRPVASVTGAGSPGRVRWRRLY